MVTKMRIEAMIKCVLTIYVVTSYIPKLPFFEYCLSKYSCIIKHCSNYKEFANNYYRICIGTDKKGIVSYTPANKKRVIKRILYVYGIPQLRIIHEYIMLNISLI